MKKAIVLVMLLIFMVASSVFIGAYLYKHGYFTPFSNQVTAWLDDIRYSKNKKPHIELNNNYIFTNNYKFNVIDIVAPSASVRGALEVFDGNLLFIDGRGKLVEIDDNNVIQIICEINFIFKECKLI